MGLTTERKVFFALAGIAGLALFIDQGFLGPREAAAESPGIPTAPVGESTLDDAEISDPIESAASILINRLGSVSSTDRAGSLGASFSLTQLIEPAFQSESVEAPTEHALPLGALDNQETFPIISQSVEGLPTLSAAMPATHGGGAVLDGKLVRVGETGPNGYRLILVHSRSVLVERNGEQFAIEIPSFTDDD